VDETVNGTVVRPARADDAASIARIYNEGIEDRVATFETEPRSPADILAILDEHGDTYPSLVATRAGAVIAFAWAGSYSPRPCYAGIGAVSVYVGREARGAGAGRLALAALVDACERRGFWKLVSRVFPENSRSRAMCRAVGFREVGVYARHGRLDGVWRDCVIVERLLGAADLERAAAATA
jgi:L-amino acid N-acyltransferase YncA